MGQRSVERSLTESTNRNPSIGAGGGGNEPDKEFGHCNVELRKMDWIWSTVSKRCRKKDEEKDQVGEKNNNDLCGQREDRRQESKDKRPEEGMR